MTSSTPTIGKKVGRARRSLGQLWQVPTFVVGLLTFFGVAVSAPWRHTPEWYEFESLITSIQKGVDKDPPGKDLIENTELALERLTRFPSRSAQTYYLAGSAYWREAQHKPAIYAKELWPTAVKYLEKAQADPELPDAYRPTLQYRLGFCLYQQGRDVRRALELMTQAMDKGAEQSLSGYQLILQANLKLDPPNVEHALTASQRILDLTPEESTEALAQARIAHVELLIRNKMRSEALKVLELIGSKVPRPVRVNARLLQTRCLEEEGLWDQATHVWQELLKDEKLVDGGRARICYALGWCYHQMEPPRHPETLKAWSEALDLGGPAGQAAGLRLGELRMSMGEAHARQAIDDWQRALESVSLPGEFKNPYIELAQAKELLLHALKSFQKERDPQKAQEVAALYRKLVPGFSADREQADAERELAEQLQRRLLAKMGNVTAAEVAAQFRRAAEAYKQLAQAGSAASRAEALWQCAHCYSAAKETKPAQEILRQYVLLDTNETRLAEGWYLLGDIYRGQANQQDAHKAYVQCLQYPNTPFAFRAKYYLAVEEIDKKNYKQAQGILEEILLPGATSIDRPSQEKSLYKLASLLVQTKDYAKAMVYLKDCLRLYPDNPNVVLAREQLGECYRRLAEKEAQLEADVRSGQRPGEITPERRQQLDEQARHHRRTKFEWLANAIKTYQALAEDLEARGKIQPLSKVEQILLRRAWFGLGECHFDSEEYHEGLRIFRRLQQQQPRTLEGFYASLRICNLAEVFKEPEAQAKQFQEMAKESLRMLVEELKGMPEDHELFRTPGVSTRERWQRWTDSMQSKLVTPARVAGPPDLPFIP